MERRRWRFALAVLPLVAMGCVTAEQSEAGNPTDLRAVRDLLEAYYDDFSVRDWDAFAGHFWPGADITTVWQPPGEARSGSSSFPSSESLLPSPKTTSRVSTGMISCAWRSPFSVSSLKIPSIRSHR